MDREQDLKEYKELKEKLENINELIATKTETVGVLTRAMDKLLGPPEDPRDDKYMLQPVSNADIRVTVLEQQQELIQTIITATLLTLKINQMESKFIASDLAQAREDLNNLLV